MNDTARRETHAFALRELLLEVLPNCPATEKQKMQIAVAIGAVWGMAPEKSVPILEAWALSWGVSEQRLAQLWDRFGQ